MKIVLLLCLSAFLAACGEKQENFKMPANTKCVDGALYETLDTGNYLLHKDGKFIPC